MKGFQNPIDVKAEVASNDSVFHELKSGSTPVSPAQLIRKCLSQISPDRPGKSLAAAKILSCTLRAMANHELIRQRPAEYNGVCYLLKSLEKAIGLYEREGKISELMFVSMRIGSEVASYQSARDQSIFKDHNPLQTTTVPIHMLDHY